MTYIALGVALIALIAGTVASAKLLLKT